MLDSSFDSIASASTASTSGVPCAQSTENIATEVQSNTSQISSFAELVTAPNVASAAVSTSNTATATTKQQPQQQQEQRQQTPHNNAATKPVVSVTTSTSAPAVNHAADSTASSVTSCNDSDSQTTSTSCPFHGFIPPLSDHPVQIKTEPGVQIKSEPVDTGYETSVIGTTCRVNVRVKEEPTNDNRSQSKAAESVSGETIVSIGQSDTELPPPTSPPPPIAAPTAVAHEELDSEATDEDVTEKVTENVPEKGIVSQDVSKEAAILASNIRNNVEDTYSDDSGICSRPSSRNTPIQKRKKDVFSDSKLLRAVVVLQRLEDIVNSGRVRKRKKSKDRKRAVIESDDETESEEKDQCENDSDSLEPQTDAEKEEPKKQHSGNAQAQSAERSAQARKRAVIESEDETESEEKDQCENDSDSLEPQTDAEKEEPEKQHSGNAQAQSPERSAQPTELNNERSSPVNSSGIGDRDNPVKPNESDQRQTESKSSENNTVIKELKIVLFKDEISPEGDIDSVRKDPVKSKCDTEIKCTPSSKSQEKHCEAEKTSELFSIKIRLKVVKVAKKKIQIRNI